MPSVAPRLVAVTGVLLALLATPRAPAAEPVPPWSAWSASPIPVDPTPLAPLEQETLSRCGVADAGLLATARAVLARTLDGQPVPDPDDVAMMQRAAGEPHPWARAWVARGRKLDSATTLSQLDAWLGSPRLRAQRRCGVATGTAPDGNHEVAVVAVDALADLKALPTRARPGQWLDVEARLRVRSGGGTVVVLGPSGPPRSLITSFDGLTLRARFAPDRQGQFTLQVLADVAGGPRPVLEAIVFAGVEPPVRDKEQTAPGEDVAEGMVNDDARLECMIDAARASVGVGPMARDVRLDEVARDHALRMAQTHQLAHDAGDGDPSERLRAAGVDARFSGENVAHAPTLPLAHRALWASPSHRSNLLRREFDRFGVGVVRDERGERWVVETFVDAR